MFHVLLALPALAVFGALGAAAIFILSVPLCVGIVLQLLLTVFGQAGWVRCVPAGLGVLGLAGSLGCFLPELSPIAILVYWGIYFLALWLTWLIVTQIKKAAAKWTGRE